MNEQAAIAEDVRMRILQEPDVILEDIDVMRALIAANDRSMGGNIVDLRGVAMDRLEARLQRLEDTHRSVVAAAYENLAGMNQVHRAINAFLEPLTFEGFLDCVGNEVVDILRVGKVRLVLESQDAAEADVQHEVLAVVNPGFISDYIGQGRAIRRVSLRRVDGNARLVYGEGGGWVQSEACILLDFGPNRLPGMLAFGSDSAMHFSPNQGTDLLDFMGGVFERAMRRWLE